MDIKKKMSERYPCPTPVVSGKQVPGRLDMQDALSHPVVSGKQTGMLTLWDVNGSMKKEGLMYEDL